MLSRDVDCAILIKMINDAIESTAMREFQKHDITLSQIRHLEYIHERGGKDVLLKEIESHFNVSQPTVVGIMKRLEKKGLIYLKQDKNDQRAKTANLSPTGIRFYAQAETAKKELDNLIFKPLTEQEQNMLKESLRKVYIGLIKT